MQRSDRLWDRIALLGRSRLCWRITLTVFMAIFLVEAAILVPSYYNYERDLLARLEEAGRSAVIADFMPLAGGGTLDLREAGAALTGGTMLRGGAVYRPGGAAIGTFGEAPLTSLEAVRAGAPLSGYVDGKRRYEVVWNAAETGLPFTIIGRIDSTRIAPELLAFLGRIGGLILLISDFVCLVTMVILGRLVLVPLLTIRNNLVDALSQPQQADRYTLADRRGDELGEVIAKLNEMLRHTARMHREELATMMSMVERSADAMIAYDPAGNVVYANRACLTLCGFDDLDSMSAAGLPRFEPARSTEAGHLIDLLETGAFTGETVFHGAHGSTVSCLLSAARLDDTDGRPSRYFATITNISELRSAYDSLERQNMELAASGRTKVEFLTNVSHELRTPLNAIIVFSNIMRNELGGALGSPQYKDFVHHIHESGTHLLTLINDILDLSRIETGKLELTEETIDIAEIIEASLRMIKLRAEQQSIALATNFDPTLPRLRADGHKLKQILINLLSNAVKFTQENGKITVTAEVERDGGLVIGVADTGLGIVEDDLSRVFDPFVQADGSLERRYDGAGLGLPLTKAMVELHDGDIEITSRLGEGTTVTVRLPASRVVADDNVVTLAAG